MTNIGTAARHISATLIQRLFATVLLSSALIGAALAQNSVLDSSTPPGLAPGAPAGSYALSDLDNINLFNGNLSFQLPLLKMGGRGGAGYTMMLRFERKWIVINEVIEQFGTFSIPSDAWWQFVPNYSPGRMDVRQSGVAAGCISLGGVPDMYYPTTLTRLTFTAPDGTEFEMRDQLTGGKPLTNSWTPCDGTTPVYPQRGSVFVTADGTSATFISDTPLHDAAGPNNGLTFEVSGFLTLRDGTRYRIDNNLVSWMRDRNGNKVSFTYQSPFGPLTAITDSLNRQVTIAYRDPASNINYDQITYKGFGGATRTIRVHYAPLSQALRADYSPQQALTVAQLFPELNGSDPYMIYDPTMVSSVELPDGRRYRFYYNHYSELTRAELPTGGSIEYDYTPGSGVVGTEIIRGVVARRVYTGGGAGGAFDGQTTYRYDINLTANMTTVVVNQLNPSGALLSRERHYFYGTVWDSFGLGPTSYAFWLEGKEYQTERLDTDDPNSPDGGAVLQRAAMTWQQRAPVSWWQPFMGPEPANDPRLVETVTMLADANLVSKQAIGYDQYNNQTDVYEYGFGAGAPGPLIRRTQTSYLTTNPYQGNANYAADYNIHIRNLPVQKIVYDASGTVRSQTDYTYDDYGTFAVIGRPGIVQHADTLHYGAWGNLTEVILRNPDRPQGDPVAEIHLYNQYDIAGNVVKTVDGRGFATDYDYSDRFDSSPDDEAESNAGATELTGGFTYAFPTKVTNALGHTTYTQYDYYLGRPVNTEDANGVVSSVAYNDALDRPTQGIQARYVVGVGVPAVRRQTVIVYNDSGSPVNGYPARSITTISDKDVFGESNSGNGLKSVALYDGLGRTWRGAAYEGSTWSITDTQFDELGRVSQVSNPYRAADPGSASPPSGLWTTTNYDALGRIIKMTTPDGAHVDTAYSGNQVTVTDQAGKKRRSVTDALGRLVLVIEDPGGLNYQTSYLYDVLGNLRKVTQGAQSRWFAYDSLSRLIRVKNPEQDANSNLSYTDPYTNDGNGWSMAYSYDANGNLVSKTDARNITTNYAYDALNRNTSVNYSSTATNPDITRLYDKPNPGAYGIGRYWHDYAGGGWGVDPNVDHTAIDSYDPLGRPLTKRQLFIRNGIQGPTYSINQTYDLAGNLKTVTYPSGRTVNYGYDQAGRLSSFSGSLGGSSYTYANMIGYNAAGQMIKERFVTNTPLYHNLHYNSRLQLVDTRLGDIETDEWNFSRGAISFSYGTTAVASGNLFANDTDNNGNLRRQTNYVPLASGGYVVSQRDDYTYDQLNRVSSFNEAQMNSSGQWSYVASQNLAYDRYGNRWITGATGGVNGYNPTYDTTNNNNRIVGLGYDAAGNITLDPLSGGTMIYDAENRLLTATNGSGGSYTYNADGRRVRRITAGQETWYIYGIGGELLTEYAATAAPSAPQKEYGYRSGQLLVVWDGSETGDRQLQWLVQDHLGSTRMVVDRSGSLGGIRRHDFGPFGEELLAGAVIRSASNGYSGDSVRQKFGSKERDNETGLDFFEARYFSSAQGRFTSLDPVWVTAKRIVDPQQLNLYSYVRNNPLKLVDPNGMDLILSAANEEEARKKFNTYQLGFRQEDRAHVQLVVGDGKNGFQKGQFGIRIDKDHKSTSENFQVSQKLANDRTALGKITVVNVGESHGFRSGGDWSEKGGWKLITYSQKIEDAHTPFEGYTFFEYRGKVESGVLYSPGNYSELIINGGLDEIEISATMHHELRHLRLGDFGRSVHRADHSKKGKPRNEADNQTDRAEAEAKQNANKKP